MRILTEIREYNPNVLFLLENVEMGKKWETIFNKAIGTQGIHINSSLVSAQSRKRIYWTNINDGNISQPKDKGLFLRNILEDEVDEHFFLSEKALKGIELHKKRNKEKGNGFGADIRKPSDKSQTISIGGKGIYDLVLDSRVRRLTPTECARLQTIPEWYKWQCSNTQQYKMLGNGWTVEAIKHIFGYMIE